MFGCLWRSSYSGEHAGLETRGCTVLCFDFLFLQGEMQVWQKFPSDAEVSKEDLMMRFQIPWLMFVAVGFIHAEERLVRPRSATGALQR